MKRMLLLLIVVLGCLAALPAMADSLPIYRVYQINDETPAIPKLMGSAVLMNDQSTLLTSIPGLTATHTLFVVGPGLEAATGLLRLQHISNTVQVLTLATPAQMEPMKLCAVHEPVCMGLTIGNEPVQCTPTQVQQSVYGQNRLPAVEATLTANLLPGAILTNGADIGGLVVAQRTDGDNRYTVLLADLVEDMLSAIYTVDVNQQRWISTEADVLQIGSELVIDWTKLDLSSTSEADQVWVAVLNPDNPFYEYNGADIADGSARFIIVPGCSYAVWAYVGTQFTLDTPEAEYVMAYTFCDAPFTDYAYKDTQLCLAIAQGSDANDLTLLPEGEPISAELLMDTSRVYMNVVSTYQVPEAIHLTGAITLLTPDGFSFADGSGFVLYPEIQSNDPWAYPMADLLDTYLQYSGAFAPGEYTLSYYFGNQPVTVMHFTVE